MVEKMNELVLYRKYRPQKFSEIVDQEAVVRTLLNAISSGKIAHAYLFCGPRGSGKTTAARLMAKAVNCEDKKNAEPCNRCASCKEIMSGKAMDLIEIDAASHRGIDEVRELREGIRFSPSRLRYKVFILDEAHQLTSGAANALLKILEEAPSHAVFILATTEPEKMIPTVISRCQRFNFQKISAEGMIKRLQEITRKEGYKIDKEALKIITSVADGSLRDGESLLSQALSFLPGRDIIQKEDVEEFLGLVERQISSGFVDALIEKNGARALEILDQTITQGRDPRSFHAGLMMYLRELMIFKIISSGKENGLSSEKIFPTLTKEEIEKLKEQTNKENEDGIRKMIEIFLEAGRKLNYSPIPQLPLEVAVAEIVASS